MVRFEIGKLVATTAIAERCKRDKAFYIFVRECLIRHISCDWGDLDTEDKQMNDEAVKEGFRIMSAYFYNGDPEDKIWIITEWDRSYTTILFPSEY